MPELSLPSFVWRVTASHMLTYFVVGIVAATVFDYADLYASTELHHIMRPTNSAWAAAGAGLQVIRGAMFGLVLWPFADRLVRGTRGALSLWSLLVGLAVLGATGPAPGSLEGVIFTTLPLRVVAIGMPEVLVQTGLFSFAVMAWHRRPARWLNVAAGIGVALVLLMSVLGVLAARGVLATPHG